MKKEGAATAANTEGGMSKADFEKLADFRYQLRRFLRFSEQATRMMGATSLQYLLMLHIKGLPARERATVGELAERLQAKHHGVVSLVSRCEAAGWVRRTISSGDRRRVEVALTEEGSRRLAQLVRLHRAQIMSRQAAGFLGLHSQRLHSIVES
jgi:DNA-binding MarR family transcriptional regulator